MNKIKIGDKVQYTTKAHASMTEHTIDYFRVGNRFKKEDYEEIAMLLLSKARRAKLKGKAIGYGSTDDDFKNKRKFVRVEFKYKDMKTEFYCSENELRKL